MTIPQISIRKTDSVPQTMSLVGCQFVFPDLSGQGESVDAERNWDADTLQDLLRTNFENREVIVVSNREPYIHSATPDGISVQRPASGLVTALESVVSACSGTWIAHGSGTADKQSCDSTGHLGVPIENPRYVLRRLWLDEREEEGYYKGFSNEGLWPLCHIAHVRPRFCADDWDTYQRVNSRFAAAVVEEAATKNPIVLVQDYHLALVPKMIRERLPTAIILTFWHIPWPTPDAFWICPWREEIVEGLLGSTTIGFQTIANCENFLKASERLSNREIDHAAMSAAGGEGVCHVKNYPISIAWPGHDFVHNNALMACRKAVFDDLGLSDKQQLLLGVDRLDYTKGIEEKFLALELLLERCPEYRGRFTLLQIAAPTRCTLEAYQLLESRVMALATRINDRFSQGHYHPIVLIHENCDASTIDKFYRACDVCLVTSLHDGMNLVAKEFVAARQDGQGVLILSEFAGAAVELPEALIVNPYHIEQVADAILQAIEMQPGERALRMQRMRGQVRAANVFQWAARMLVDGVRFGTSHGDHMSVPAKAPRSAPKMSMST